MNLFSLLYIFFDGGRLYRQLYYAQLIVSAEPITVDRRMISHYGPDFTIWHKGLLFLINPMVSLYYGYIFNAVVSFIYCIFLVLYLAVCYFVALCLLCEASHWVWYTAALYNRGSIFRHTYYFARCYVRDVLEGHRSMPHALQPYLVACVLWSYYCCVLSGSLQFVSIVVFSARIALRGRQYGELCRPASMATVLVCGFLCWMPMSMLCIVLVAEAVYPTMGDDDTCVVFDVPSVSPMHPGYVGSKLLLDGPAKIAPD